MTIDWTHFTPLSALGGGAMIGAAAGLLILGMGRILGAAGILAGALAVSRQEANWRWFLIAGLMLSPGLAHWAWAAQAPEISTHWPILVAGGLCVGFGARLGSGCTSGHGVCGVSRLSPRSMLATSLFTGSGFATTYFIRHILA